MMCGVANFYLTLTTSKIRRDHSPSEETMLFTDTTQKLETLRAAVTETGMRSLFLQGLSREVKTA